MNYIKHIIVITMLLQIGCVKSEEITEFKTSELAFNLVHVFNVDDGESSEDLFVSIRKETVDSLTYIDLLDEAELVLINSAGDETVLSADGNEYVATITPPDIGSDAYSIAFRRGDEEITAGFRVFAYPIIDSPTTNEELFVDDNFLITWRTPPDDANVLVELTGNCISNLEKDDLDGETSHVFIDESTDFTFPEEGGDCNGTAHVSFHQSGSITDGFADSVVHVSSKNTTQFRMNAY